jgi:hypothetical protein
MFGKKQGIKTEEQIVQVQTIPADFYGGQNPVVKFRKVEKEIALKPAKILPAEKKMMDKATMPGAGQPAHPANLFASRKFLIIGGIILLLLFVGGSAIYYWYQAKKTPATSMPSLNQIVQQTMPEVVPPVETTTPVAEEPATTTPTTTQSAPVFSNEAPIEFPSMLLGDSADLDKDGLSDAAEEVFATDPGLPDSDSDGFADGHEVYYLYDPANKEPARLIDSGRFRDYTNANFKYKIYYPTSWALGEVDPDSRDVLFSTLTGENIEVRTIDREGLSFADWFAKWAPQEKYGDLAAFETYFGDSGMYRKDNLVYYLTDDRYVYVIVYHTTDSNVVNYRSIIQTMARSFRLPNNAGALSGQSEAEINVGMTAPAPEPGTSTATSTQ